MEKVFIAGCGYIGKRLARRCRQTGAEVSCMVRSPGHAADLEKAGFKSMVCTLDRVPSNPLEGVAGSTLFYFVPPPGGGSVDTRARNFCSALSRSAAPEKIVYVSATSVYAPAAGGVVTEEAPAMPRTARGERRLDAERTFAAYAEASGTKLIILRVSGIYGPGRLPLTHVLQRLPVLLEAEAGLSNRIHADDLANICMAAAEKGEAGDIFNISDGSPRSLTAYFNVVADTLSQPRPPQITFQQAQQVMAPLMLSYYGESHIIDNRRMLDRLGVSLLYPDMESGIRASVEVN